MAQMDTISRICVRICKAMESEIGKAHEPYSGTSIFEWVLLISSLGAPTLAFLVFRGGDWMNLASSLIGILMLHLMTRASIFSNLVSMAFSVSYAVVAFRFRYYGEMLLYLLLYLPMDIVTFAVWLRHRFRGGSQVTVDRTRPLDFVLGPAIGLIVAFGSYFLLRSLGTENLLWSTVSVFTSMVACYFLIRRTSFYAVFYAINDLILIVLWTYASVKDRSYICMAICFLFSLFNDTYAFFSWSRIRRRQERR